MIRTGYCAHAGDGCGNHSAGLHLRCPGVLQRGGPCECDCHSRPPLTEAEVAELDRLALVERRAAMEREIEFQKAGGWKGVAQAAQAELATLQAAVIEAAWDYTDGWYGENISRPRILRAAGVEGPFEQ